MCAQALNHKPSQSVGSITSPRSGYFWHKTRQRFPKGPSKRRGFDRRKHLLPGMWLGSLHPGCSRAGGDTCVHPSLDGEGRQSFLGNPP